MQIARYLHLKFCMAVILITVFGCAELGLTPAKNYDEKLAYAVGVHKAVIKAATVSLNTKKISSEEASQVLKMADDSRVILDASRAAAGMGNMDTANSKLLLATASLQAIQTYLNSRSQ